MATIEEPIYDTASSESDNDLEDSQKFDVLPEVQRQLESIV